MYPLGNTPTKYDRMVFKYNSKMARRMIVQVKPHCFNPFHSISIIRFRKHIKVAFDTDSVHGGADMYLVHFFKKRDNIHCLIAYLCADGRSTKHSWSTSGKTRYFTTYPQVSSFSLKKYVINEVIAKIEPDITRFAQPSTWRHPSELKTSWPKCSDVKTCVRSML